MKTTKPAASVALICLLSACTAVTTLSTTPPGGSVRIGNGASHNTPREASYNTRTFGYEEFRADAPGQVPLYGILPLKFNPGYLTASILFFTPAMLYSLREVYPEYEFDVAGRQVRFRKNPQEEWQVYVPTEEDARTAQAFFAAQEKPAAKP